MSPELIPMLEADGTGRSKQTALSTGRYVRFGPFQIDQQRQEVLRDGVRVKLHGKVYQVLLTLLEKPGEVVTREELREKLWPVDSDVNYDANVNTTVNKLRQALSDSTDSPLYIETIPRKGYCLVVEPEVSDVPTPKVMNPPVVSAAPNEKVASAISPKTGAGLSQKWVTIGIIGLIIAGMLLGASIATLWIFRFGQRPPIP